METCNCGITINAIKGKPNSNVLVIIDNTDGFVKMQQDIMRILRAEFAQYGVDLMSMSMAMFNPHDGATKECMQTHMNKLIYEGKGKEFVLLMGVDPVKQFLGKPAQDISSLVIPCSYFSKSKVMASINPIMGLRSIGELRLVTKRFSHLIRGE